MEYTCVLTLKKIQEYLAGADVVGFDFETSPLEDYRSEERAALDTHKAAITGVSFSVSEGSGIYVPLRHRAGRNIPKPEAVMAYLKTALFENPAVIKVAHNLAFEAMFLYALGVVVQPPCYDTIAAAQLTLKSQTLFRGLSDSGLKTLVPQLFDTELPDFLTVTGGRFFDELNPQDAETVRYACADSDYALRLYHLFNGWFDKYLPKHRRLVEQVESPTAVYCGLMRYNGLLVDRTAMEAKRAEAMKRLSEIREEIAFIIGDVEIGQNASTSAFKSYLYNDLKLPVLKTTAKYQEAADDEAMILLADWCRENRPELVRLFELVQEYRRWGKIKGTYLDGYLRHINEATGRIHPDLLPLGTETGRFACRNPNLQNQVAPGDDPIGVRNLIVAPKGYLLLEADYSQVELRIAAYLSKDPTMLGAYARGEDIHAITTSAVFGISIEEAKDKHSPDYKHRRTVAKGTMFGILYGIYAKGLSRNLKANAGVLYSEEECKRYIQGIKRRYTRLAEWQEIVKRQTKVRRYSETALGRRRYLPDISSLDFRKRNSAERMALNSPVQGLAADCLKCAMGRLVVALQDKPYIRPLMTVHDSLIFEVRENAVAEAILLIRRCMEETPLPDMPPLVAEVSIGSKYGSMEDVENGDTEMEATK